MNIRDSIVLLVFFVCAQLLTAQHYRMHPDVPVDSSYNARNELVKNSKKFPGISLVGYGELKNLLVQNELVYEQYGKRKMHLDLVRPAGQQNVPVVVIVHAGGWRSGEKDMDRHIAYELSRRGFATVCVEYRLSMEAKYPAGVQDVKTAIRWVRANARKYALDQRRVAILGTSAGGQLAALIGTENGTVPLYRTASFNKYSDKVQAIVDIDGVLMFIHPESAEGKDLPGKPSAATWWFGSSMQENPDVFNEASALTHVGAQSAPVLFVNSVLPRFHAGRDDMIAKLNALGIYTEVHTIENTPHTFWLFHPWFDEAITYVDQFLKKVLK